MLTRHQSPATAEPEIQALLRLYHAQNDRKKKAERRAEQARIVRELAALGLNCN